MEMYEIHPHSETTSNNQRMMDRRKLKTKRTVLFHAAAQASDAQSVYEAPNKTCEKTLHIYQAEEMN